LKGSRTVRDGGKGGDNFKTLPIVITSLVGAYLQLIKQAEEVGELVSRKNVAYII